MDKNTESKKIPSAREFYYDTYPEGLDDDLDSSFWLAEAYAEYVVNLINEGWVL